MRILAAIRYGLLIATLVLPVSAWAQITYSVLVDTDTDEATGCEVDLPVSGVTVTGIERRLSATVDPVAAQVTGVTLAICEGAAFGPPSPVAGSFPYPVATNGGAGGEDVVELAIDLAAIAPAGTTVRVYATAQTADSDDLLATVDGTPTGAPILFTLGAGPGAIPHRRQNK